MLDRVKRILIAEDHPDDVKPLVKVFKREPAWEIAVVTDGVEALDFIFRRGSYAEAWRPDLFILSINMPKVDGLEVLQRIKDTDELATIPVVMWTMSQSSVDIDRAYKLGAAAFVPKPLDDKMESCANAIRAFWDWVWYTNRE